MSKHVLNTRLLRRESAKEDLPCKAFGNGLGDGEEGGNRCTVAGRVH